MAFNSSDANQKIIDGVIVLSEFDADSLPNPPADKVYLYTEDDGSGNTVVKTKDSNGVENGFQPLNATLSALSAEVIPDSLNLYTPEAQNIVFEGDSIVAAPTAYGSSTTIGVMLAALPGISGTATFYNVATGGYNLAQITSEYDAQVKPLRPIGSVKRSWLILSIGANDWVYDVVTQSAWVTDYLSYTAAAKADGFSIIVVGMPRAAGGADAEHYQRRKAFLKTIRTDPNILGLIDIAELLGDPGSDLWHDHVHPSAIGNGVLARALAHIILAGGSVRSAAPITRQLIERTSARPNALLGTGVDWLEGASGGTYSPELQPLYTYDFALTWTFVCYNNASNKTLIWSNLGDALGVYISQGQNGSFETGPWYLIVTPVGGSALATVNIPYEKGVAHCVSVSRSGGFLRVFFDGELYFEAANSTNFSTRSSTLCEGGSFLVGRPIYMSRGITLDEHQRMMRLGRPPANALHLAQTNLSTGAWVGGGGWSLSANSAGAFSVTAATNGTARGASTFMIAAGDDMYAEFTVTKSAGLFPFFALVRADLTGYRTVFFPCVSGLNRVLMNSSATVVEVGSSYPYFASQAGGDAFTGTISDFRLIKRKVTLWPARDPVAGAWASAQGDPCAIELNDGIFSG